MELSQSRDDIAGLSRVGFGVGKINLVIANGFVGVVLTPGNFTKTKGDLY